jgi:hypothetical protein
LNPESVTYEQLLKQHPERTKWERRWLDYGLAYKGGDEFLAAAGSSGTTRSGTTALLQSFGGGLTNQARRFLWQMDGEPVAKYNNRWERASYTNYLGAIVDYFRHYLYSAQPKVLPVEGKAIPEWWAPFFANANGAGMSLFDVGRETFLDVLLYRRAGWLVGTSDSVASNTGDGVVLTPYNALDILDWQRNDCGELDWVTLRKKADVREFPDDRRQVEIITYANRNEWHTWEVDKDENGGKAQYVGGAAHGLDEVPFVMREIPPGLWVADKLFSPCMSLFNRMNALESAEHLGCFLQPYVKSMEQDAQSRILGEGILLHLRTGDGQREGEDFGWKSPDVSPLAHLAERLKQDRDELYRVTHQMSLAVDSAAVSAVARSGASKVEDRRATEIILSGYGQYELRALVQTANLLSKVHGDNTQWAGDGFDNFQVSSLDEELTLAALVESLPIVKMSPTFRKRVYIKLAGRILDNEDESTKVEITREIEEYVDDDEGAANVAPVVPPPPQMQQQPVHDLKPEPDVDELETDELADEAVE